MVEFGLVLKIAGIGMLVAIISTVLSKAGKDEHAMLVTVGGILVVMLMLLEGIGEVISTLETIFGL